MQENGKYLGVDLVRVCISLTNLCVYMGVWVHGASVLVMCNVHECVSVCVFVFVSVYVCMCSYAFMMFLTQNWRKLNKSGNGRWPEERCYHAACCLNYGQHFPQLLVSGGLDRQHKPLADLWILDIERGNWRKVRQTFHHCILCVWIVYHYVFPYYDLLSVCPYYSCLNVITMQVSVTLKARWGHSLTAFSLGPGLTEVVEFGGSSEPLTGSDETQSKIADTALLQFSELAHNTMNGQYNHSRSTHTSPLCLGSSFYLTTSNVHAVKQLITNVDHFLSHLSWVLLTFPPYSLSIFQIGAQLASLSRATEFNINVILSKAQLSIHRQSFYEEGVTIGIPLWMLV